MSSFRPLLWLGCWLTSLVVVVGCGGSTDGSAGSLAVDLVLADGAEISQVEWRISGGDMAPMEGTIDTSAPGSTASVEVFGLPPGEEYLLKLSATSDDGLTTCKGSMNFDVSEGQVTEVFVMLQCTRAPDSGGVRVETEINLCGELVKVVVSPLQTSIGNDIDLVADAADAEGDPIEYLWTASGGSIADPTSPVTTFTCGVVGRQFVRIQVSDADHCVDEWTVPVTCVDGGGAGGSGGTGGAAGSAGAGGMAGSGGSSCETTCGVGSEFPTGGPVDTERLNCSVMGIPIPLEFDLTALSEQMIEPGENTITTAFQSIIPSEVVNLVLALADSADITDTFGLVATTATPATISLGLSPVPCLVCFEPDTPVFVTNDPSVDNFEVNGSSVAFELTDVTVSLSAAGLPLVLTTEGPGPNCQWAETPPRVTLGAGNVGFCTNPEDGAVYDVAQYTNADGESFFGDAAVAEVGMDCPLGSSTLVSEGCGPQVGAVLANNTPANRAALSACIEECIVDQGFGLSPGCLDCYGDQGACEWGSRCVGTCATDDESPACIECLCDANCFQDFDDCSGLPSGNQCSGGSGGVGGSAGTGGIGGTGGSGGEAGFCTNSEDDAVFDSAEYTDQAGTTFFGDQAVAEVGMDCVLGAATLVSDGCGLETAAVLANNNPENRAALATCIEACIDTQGFSLSQGCLDCYGDMARCGAAFCAGPCAADVEAPACVECRCNARCFEDFNVCSGRPAGNPCNGGTGGTGGFGGTGGSGGECEQTCGVGNEFPAGSPVASGDFNCTVMGIPIPLTFNFTAVADGEITDGDNDITVAAQTVVPARVVDLILALTQSAAILNTTGSVNTSGVPTRLSVLLTEVPCEVCFEPDTPNEITLDPRTETFSVSGGSIDLDLAEVTVIIDAAGVELVLSNAGADPDCAWDSVPSLTLGSPTP